MSEDSHGQNVPQVGASARDLEVVAEDEQQFLLRQQQYLQQGAAPPPVSGMTSVQKTPDRKNVGSPGVQGSPKKVRVDIFDRLDGVC